VGTPVRKDGLAARRGRTANCTDLPEGCTSTLSSTCAITTGASRALHCGFVQIKGIGTKNLHGTDDAVKHGTSTLATVGTIRKVDTKMDVIKRHHGPSCRGKSRNRNSNLY